MSCERCHHCREVARFAAQEALAAFCDTIVAEVASTYRLTPERLKSPDRALHVAMARSIAYYLIRDLTKWPWTRIGRLLARDHSTVIKGYDHIRLRMFDHPAFAAEIARLRTRIEGQPRGHGYAASVG